MSRARDHTTIHATADDLPQAVDDLQSDWSVARHQRWISDTPARLGRQTEPVRAGRRPANVRPRPAPSLSGHRANTQRRLIDLHDDYDELLAGAGRWADTQAGAAARTLSAASQQLTEARRVAKAPAHRRRDRRDAANALPRLEAAVETAARHWDHVGEPEARRLHDQITSTDQELTELSRAAMKARLDRMQTRGTDRAAGLDRGLGV